MSKSRKTPPVKSAAPVPPSPPKSLRIQSLDQADQALREIAEARRIAAAATTKFQTVCDAARKTCERKLFVDVAGTPVKIADYIAERETDLEEFATSMRSEIFEDDKKTLELNHGQIGFRLSNPSVELLPPAKGVKESAWQKTKAKVVVALLKALSTMRLGIKGLNSRLISVKVEPNRSNALAAYKIEEVTDAQLAKIGLMYNAPVDRFFYDAKAESIASHPSETSSSS